ncbi:MAG: translation initiation factor IF-3 [Rikenellaceae bacterium]
MAGAKPFHPKPFNPGANRPRPAGGLRGRRLPEKENPHRTNKEIDVPQVRLVGDNIETSEVLSTREALRMADEMELDLIEISPKADPPVCRIADYSKFLYQQKKKAKELKANQTKTVLKEIRFGPQTDDHDYNFKLKHAENFIKEGAKVKAYVFFRGRSIVFKEQGEILLLRFATDLEEIAKVESMPRLEGKKMNMILAPKSKK